MRKRSLLIRCDERREIEQYAKLLDPDFRFYFQQADIPAGLPREYWNRDEDSTGTGALFDATEVSGINLDLGAFTVEDSVRVEDPGVKRIRLTHVKLEVELISGTTLLVQGDIQDMYFRKGRVEAGTDSTKWYLFEWQDLRGGGGSPGGEPRVGSDRIAAAAQRASWKPPPGAGSRTCSGRAARRPLNARDDEDRRVL